jgi:hypothetical protein
MAYTLRLKTLTGGEHLLGTLRWDGRWVVSGDIGWVFDYVEAVLPAGVDPIRVTPEDGEDFLFAAWFSVRANATWGELVADDGHSLSPDEAMAECERRAAART